MKIVVFGMDVCPDCEEAKKELDAAGAEYLYQEISESTANMKRFLKLRDKEPLFDKVKEEGKIGVPCFKLSLLLDLFDKVKEEGKIGVPCFKLSDGTLTLDLQEVLQKIQG